MASNLVPLKHRPVLAALVLGLVAGLLESGPLEAGQPILFSAPAGDSVNSNVLSLLPRTPVSLNFESDSPASAPFNLNGPPMAAPMFAPVDQSRWQDLSDRHRDWILMTPAEILGVMTPEKILGVQEHDAAGQPKNLTALERYNERQNQTLLPSTNMFRTDGPSPTWNFSEDSRELSDKLSSLHGKLFGDPASLASPLLSSGPGNQILAGQDKNGGWTRLFEPPTSLAAPNLAQQRNLETFRQLLGSRSPAVLGTTPSANEKPFALPDLSSRAQLGQPSFNPIGATVSPLNSGISRPADLPTLPSAWSMSYTSFPPATAWGPQVPPWTSAGSQPFAVPQRKF